MRDASVHDDVASLIAGVSEAHSHFDVVPKSSRDITQRRSRRSEHPTCLRRVRKFPILPAVGSWRELSAEGTTCGHLASQQTQATSTGHAQALPGFEWILR